MYVLLTYCLELLQDELPPGQVKCSKLVTFVLVPEIFKKKLFICIIFMLNYNKQGVPHG